MMYGYDEGSMMGGGYNLYGILIFLVLLVIVGFAIYKLFSTNSSNTNDQSMAILKAKLVKGEITEEEYLKKKRLIQHK